MVIGNEAALKIQMEERVWKMSDFITGLQIFSIWKVIPKMPGA